MLTIQQIDTNCSDQVNRFIDLPYRLYANCPQWLPPPRTHEASYLNRQEHPFYAHSEADFFIAVRDGRDVGRIAVLAHAPGRELYGVSEPHFYLFECEDDQEAADALFAQAVAWARDRGQCYVVGPLGFGLLDPQHLLVDGFDYPQATTMSVYNHDYYPRLLEAVGFVPKGHDIASYHLDVDQLSLPTWVHELAATMPQKDELYISGLSSLEEVSMLGLPALQQMAREMGNELSDAESAYLIQQMLPMIDPQLIQAVLHSEDGLIALVLGFPDLSEALRREPGKLNSAALQVEMANTKTIIFNGMFIDPRHQIMGLSALLICEMTKLAQAAEVDHAYLVHVGGPGDRNAHDMSLIGAKPVHWHRMYAKELSL